MKFLILFKSFISPLWHQPSTERGLPPCSARWGWQSRFSTQPPLTLGAGGSSVLLFRAGSSGSPLGFHCLTLAGRERNTHGLGWHHRWGQRWKAWFFTRSFLTPSLQEWKESLLPGGVALQASHVVCVDALRSGEGSLPPSSPFSGTGVSLPWHNLARVVSMIENRPLFTCKNTTNFSTGHRIELFSGSVHWNEFQMQVFLVTETTDLRYLSEEGVPLVIVNTNFRWRIIDL